MTPSSQRPSSLRKGEFSFALGGRPLARTREPSPRQLPTDHDHEAGLARSSNIRLIIVDHAASTAGFSVSSPNINGEKATTEKNDEK